MEHAKKGVLALERSDSQTAATEFTKALIEHPLSPDYFTQRSIAFTRLKPARYDLALRDAEYAVLLGQRRQKREKIQAGQQRRVIALYGMKRYDEAKHILITMTKWLPKDSKPAKMEHDMWMARVSSKSKTEQADARDFAAITEYPTVDLPREVDMKKWLESQLDSDGNFVYNAAVISEDLSTAKEPSSDTPATVSLPGPEQQDGGMTTANAPALATINRQPIRHDWYQDTKSITITLYAKKVDKTKLESTFTSDSAKITFPYPDSPAETFSITLDPTFATIDSSASTCKVLGTKVEVKLVKQQPGVKWAALDDKTRPKSDKLPSAWTTKGDQDWDTKVAALDKKAPKPKKNADEGAARADRDDDGADSDANSDFGGDAVDGFFKKLYAGADDDTRRAMMKSFQESNGTALSTNWSEVGKGKVEEVKSRDA